jgi:hypothetical protein
MVRVFYFVEKIGLNFFNTTIIHCHMWCFLITTSKSKILALSNSWHQHLKQNHESSYAINSLFLYLYEWMSSSHYTYILKDRMLWNHTSSRRGEMVTTLIGCFVTYIYFKINVMASHNCLNINTIISPSHKIISNIYIWMNTWMKYITNDGNQ